MSHGAFRLNKASLNQGGKKNSHFLKREVFAWLHLSSSGERPAASKQTAYQTAIKAKQRSQTEETHRGSHG